jgi:hypothetical protein
MKMGIQNQQARMKKKCGELVLPVPVKKVDRIQMQINKAIFLFGFGFKSIPGGYIFSRQNIPGVSLIATYHIQYRYCTKYIQFLETVQKKFNNSKNERFSIFKCLICDSIPAPATIIFFKTVSGSKNPKKYLFLFGIQSNRTFGFFQIPIFNTAQKRPKRVEERRKEVN